MSTPACLDCRDTGWYPHGAQTQIPCPSKCKAIQPGILARALPRPVKPNTQRRAHRQDMARFWRDAGRLYA